MKKNYHSSDYSEIALKAFEDAIYKVILEAKKENRKLSIWEKNKVKYITADEALKYYKKIA